MNHSTLLYLLQMNLRMLRTRIFLHDYLCVKAPSVDEILRYLCEHETLFYQNICKDKNLVRSEQDNLKQLEDQQIRFCFPGSSSYPSCFHGVSGAPFLLSFEGHPAWQLQRSIAVVGSRETSALSHTWMEEHFSSFLREQKPVVVSGGARGIDQMAHRLALRHQCPTMVLVPAGLGALYPQTLVSWRQSIIQGGGCLISEYPFHEPMRKHFFHDRNRLIAAFGAMTLLVEAKRRSGSLLTAQKTLELGKSVFVIPGHPSEASHLGNIDLLAEGATPVRDAQDLCMYFRSELRQTPDFCPMTSQATPIHL